MSGTTAKFTIKIAIVGPESTGKSTAFNAIAGAECSPANFGRTTEGINVFNLFEAFSSKKLSPSVGGFVDLPAEGNERKRHAESMEGSEKKRFRPVEWIHNEIKVKNRRGHGVGGDMSTFDVQVKEMPITMREDCQLVIVEAPGLNPNNAGSDDSRSYFVQNWDTLDGVILVVDAQEKADHEDQIENMEFICKLLKTKNIPCFILCNKVDDPDNLSGEEEYKLSEARRTVEKIWSVGCRERALGELLNSDECSKYEDIFPVFIPVSAKTAFLLRAGVSMSKDEFATKMTKEHFFHVGQQHFGRDWRVKSEDEKAKSVHELIHDEAYHQELLRMSGFDKFLSCLERTLGGQRNQAGLIRKNFNAELNKGNFKDGNLTSALHSLNDKRQIVGECEKVITDKVWHSYNKKWKQPAFEAFDKECKPDNLAFAAQKLVEYQKFCEDLDWKAEITLIQEELFKLVHLQLAVINNHANKWTYNSCKNISSNKSDAWTKLSPIDWLNILSSMLLLTAEPVFSRRFGHKIALLKRHQARFQMLSIGCSEGCEGFPCRSHESLLEKVFLDLDPHNPSQMVPLDEEFYDQLMTVGVEDDYTSTPRHMAHTGWLFCKSMGAA